MIKLFSQRTESLTWEQTHASFIQVSPSNPYSLFYIYFFLMKSENIALAGVAEWSHALKGLGLDS